MLADYLDTVIRTSTIKDKVLQVRIVLAGDTQDGLLKKPSLVKGRSNNGNLRPHHDSPFSTFPSDQRIFAAKSITRNRLARHPGQTFLQYPTVHVSPSIS